MGVAQFNAGQGLTALEVNQLPVVVSYLTTGSVSNSTAETIIGSFAIPAGDPTFPGGYWFKIFGTETITGTPALTSRIRLNSTTGSTLSSVTNTVSQNNGVFSYEGYIFFESIGTSGTFFAAVSVTDNFPGTFGTTCQPVDGIAINTTVANTIVVTAQFGTASTSNTCQTKGGALYRL